MGNQLARPVRASELASALGLSVKGDDHVFDRVLPLAAATDGALSFSRNVLDCPRTNNAVVIAPPGTPFSMGAIIEADNPRLAFAKALNWLCSTPGFVSHREPAHIHPETKISRTSVIGKGVKIGKGTVVNHFVVIADGVRIGENCVIKSGTVLGEDGFGYERDENGIPVRIPHLGSVVIGDNVEIGSLNTVCKGALGDTIVEDDVKTDDHVHIAHNCHIGRGALLTACVELSGGVEVGRFAWIGPNSAVIQKTIIGDHALIGIASNVIKPVASGETVAGNPARVLVKRLV